MTHMVFEQALWGALAVGREKERELASTSLEFEFLHQKSRCEMLIGGDDISSDVINLDWRKSDSSVDGEPQGNWRWNSDCRDIVASSPSFCRSTDRAPCRACSQGMTHF